MNMFLIGEIRFLPCVLMLSLFVVSTTTAQLPPQDILALLEFKKGIKQDPNGYIVDSWNDESIDFNGCPSSWNGIVCNGGSVAMVILDNQSLTADVDLRVFGNLTKLLKLSMSNNSISGVFPDNVADFESLKHMDLSNNLFSGSLPQEIGKLESLQNLSLAGNNFSGPLPVEISGLQSIQTLDLSRNSFSGPLPSSLTSLFSLISLNLSKNGFNGRIPDGIEALTQLIDLDLHQNELDGIADGKFLRLTQAVHVDLSGNLLTSSRAQELKFLFAISDTIQYLNLSRNQLSGSLISGGGIASLGSLKVLDLSYNQLHGTLPGFDFVYALEVLKLGNNNFSGFIPNELLKDSVFLNELDLSSNNISGSLSLITSTTLRFLNLSSNAISGELPLLIGGCTSLDLSNNQLRGNLSAMDKWENNVEYLDLSQNQLTGYLPQSSSQFLRLSHLNLSHNSLGGSLPVVRRQFPKIEVLDLSSNQLVGSLSDNFLTSPTLREAHLQDNSLSGNIMATSHWPDKSKLVVLDISGNHFNGTLPDEIGSFFNMKELNIARNGFNGSLPRGLTRLILLVSLDLSFNNFIGSLPEELPNSLQVFNSSYNDLSGVVPLNLRKFPDSSFHPGNAKLQFPNPPSGSYNSPSRKATGKSTKTILIVAVVVCCVLTVAILILLAVCIWYVRRSMKNLQSNHVTSKDSPRSFTDSADPKNRDIGGALVVSAEDLVASKKESSSEISTDEKVPAVAGLFPSKTSQMSWSPDSHESLTKENLAKLDVRSPDRLAGELHFLDETLRITPEELSRAPAEVLGRSSHGTSYKATLDNGLLLTVKWLREGVAKPRKEFAKEAKKFANIRHPNVVGVRGYYWGPTQHEKLILSDHISPGSLASFLYDRPGRKGPPLTWAQRLKIAIDVARGLNYLQFDRAVPHGNLKATNILLDGAELNARVADYCLHRLMTQAGTTEQILDAGVLGYRAPELAASKKPSPSLKSDIYAFGVVLLELLTGRCAGDVVSGAEGGVDLTDWVRLMVAEGRGPDCFDGVLMTEMASEAAAKGMEEVLEIASRCVRPVSERPGIKTVYEDLSSV